MTHRIEQLAEGIVLHLGDCRDLLATLPRAAALVTDPPYGIGFESNHVARTTTAYMIFLDFLICANIFGHENHYMSELGYDSRAVSNKILEVGRSKCIDLTIIQLLKLVYFAHGWTLALCDRPLSFHYAQAWQYGPVFPHIYRSYPGAGSKHITNEIVVKGVGSAYSDEFDEPALDIIDTVVEDYGREHGVKLSSWTHAVDSPWDVTLKSRGLYAEIDNDLIRDHFKKFIGNGGQA